MWITCNACDWGDHDLCARSWTPHPSRRPRAAADVAEGTSRFGGCWVDCECWVYNAADHPVAGPEDNPYLARVQTMQAGRDE